MTINIITDASFDPDSNKAGYAFWISSPAGKFTKYGKLQKAANSTEAEMMPIANALHYVRYKDELWGITKIIIQTDSESSIDMITNSHKRLRGKKKKQEKLRKIRGVITKYLGKFNGVNSKYEFRHIKAHSGIDQKRKYVHNWCDKHAKKGRLL